MMERTVNAERMEQIIEVFGSFDENIKKIEDAFQVRVVNRGTELKVQGDEEHADQGVRALEGLLRLAAKGEAIDEQKVRYLIDLVRSGNDDKIGAMAKDVVCVTAKGKPIKAKTLGQQKYLKAIEKHTITIGVGPAGTGKTYLAVAEAVAAFRDAHIPSAGLVLKAAHAQTAQIIAECGVVQAVFCKETAVCFISGLPDHARVPTQLVEQRPQRKLRTVRSLCGALQHAPVVHRKLNGTVAA